LTRSDLEVAVEGQKLAFWVHFNSFRTETWRGWQSPDRKWLHMARTDWKWPWNDVIWTEMTCRWQ